jgi:uncharacterized protein YkwD
MPLLALMRTRARLAIAAVALCAPLVACGGGGGSGGGGGGGGIGPLRGTVNTVDVQYTIDRINAFRASIGVAPITGNQQLHDFAVDGSQQLLNDHIPHQHFREHADAGTLFTTDGFRSPAGENQGDPRGWPPRANVRAQIDEILAMMWAEGPGGGHYDNMANTQFLRVGVGLVLDDFGRLYFTNDFSG